MVKDVFLAGGVRTPIGGFSGSLSAISAPALGSVVVRAALQRAAVAEDRVDEVIFGNVLGAGLGQNVARQVAIGAGLSPSVGAITVNKVCGSGLKSVMLAAQAIQCGDAELIVAGGTENMSQAPYLLPKARTGYRMGHGEVIDSLIRDGLWDVYNDMHMGMCGDRCAERYEFSRQQQDDFAVASYQRTCRPRPMAPLPRRSLRWKLPTGKAPCSCTGRGTDAVQRGKTARPAAGLRPRRHGHGGQRIEHQ